MLLDDFMPVYDFHEVHAIRIYASPDRIFGTIKSLTLSDMGSAKTLLWIRSLPARLMNKPRRSVSDSRPLVEPAPDGFARLAEQPNREFVLGIVGKFWRLCERDSPTLKSPQEFLLFHRPDYAKAALNFYLEDKGQGWFRLSTETRILATDPVARKKFALYWCFIYLGSALIRRTMLKVIKRTSENGP